MHRPSRRLAPLVAVPLALGGLLLMPDATAATRPLAPASCAANPNAAGNVDVTWTPPASDGGAPLIRYAINRKGLTPTVQVNDPAARSYEWVTAWSSTDTFQVRAVNSVGFGPWCHATVGAVAPPPPPPPTTGPFLPYKAGSYFTSTPGPIDAAATTAMRNFLATNPDQRAVDHPKLNGVGGNQWGMVYREGAATDPVWRLTGNVPADVAFLKTDGFHAPADLADSFTGTSDSPMVVMDRATGETVWASKVSKGTGYTVNVLGAAGAFRHDSNGLDKRRPESDSTVNFRSRGAIPDSMVIRKDRLDWAVANHTDLGYVLHLFWVETNSAAGVRLPMVTAEQGQAGWGAEGQRVSIDPAVDLSTRTCTPYARAIALTLQRHGAYLGDNAGSGTTIKLEQDQPAHVVWGNSIGQDELAGCVSWSDFVANVSAP